jgi:alkylation response protein AidB-like acyl-CoA dehydrogenase
MQHVEEAVYAEGLGLHLATLAWTEGPHPILARADAAQRGRFLQPLVDAELTAAFANTEPQGGSDVRGFATTARRDDGDWILDGHKAWITNAQFCDVVVVTAVTGEQDGKPALTAFLVEADQPGVRRGATFQTIMDDGLTGELHFEGVRVPDAHRIGEIGQGMALALTYINWRRMGRGGMCAGWGRYLIDRAVRRAKSRSAFGGRLADIQAVQHLLADAHADWYAARSTSLLAQEEIDRLGAFDVPLHPDAVRLIAVVKLVNDEAFFRVCDRALQVHGASGLAKGCPEEVLFRIARNLKIPAGTVEIQRNAIARQLLR